jgi:hypothetical protein
MKRLFVILFLSGLVFSSIGRSTAEQCDDLICGKWRLESPMGAAHTVEIAPLGMVTGNTILDF